MELLLERSDGRSCVEALLAQQGLRVTAKARKDAELSAVAALRQRWGEILYADGIKTSPVEFRSNLLQARDACHLAHPCGTWPSFLSLDLLAGFGSDGVLDTKGDAIVVSPFSFSNGGRGKWLLKDACTCAAHLDAERIRRSFLEGQPQLDLVTSLCWAPEDRHEHAYQWEDPQDEAKSVPSTDVAANLLALFGLSMLPVFPVGRRLHALGMDREATRWAWPVWRAELGRLAVKSLLGHPALQQGRIQRGVLSDIGVSHVYVSKRASGTQGCKFFTPTTGG
jgi:hypothetical protein